MLFDGKLFDVEDMAREAFADQLELNWAQVVEVQADQFSMCKSFGFKDERIPPLQSWVKCSIELSWNASSVVNGVLWILRNEFGNVFLHSRSSFFTDKLQH